VFGRLKSGVSAKSAQAEFSALAEHVERDSSEQDRRPVVLPVVASRMAADPDDVQLSFLLLGVAGMVLLIGCMNVANLLLGRASARGREVAIRQSVGASRGRLIAQMLTESLVLAAMGAGGGLLLASWAIHYFASIQLSPDLPSTLPARLDGRVVGYALIAAVTSVVLSGLWPAIRATRVDLISPARSPEAPAGARTLRGRNVLVAIQTALATMLLISASLFLKSLVFARNDNPGFRVDNVLVMGFNPKLAGFSDAKAQAFYRELEERVGSLPGVRSAALASHLPMGGSNSQRNVTAATGSAERNPLQIMFNRVGPGYFTTMADPGGARN
jgi:putative ABC transport system permease protein